MFQQVPVGIHLPPPHTSVALHNWILSWCLLSLLKLIVWAESRRVRLLLFCEELSLVSVENTAFSPPVCRTPPNPPGRQIHVLGLSALLVPPLALLGFLLCHPISVPAHWPGSARDFML